jgi:hypothetical protein
MYDDEGHFQCSVYDLLNRYGFMEGESLIPEEKPLVKKACEYLAHNLGEIEHRWQATVSQTSQHYVTFFDTKEEGYVNFYQMEEMDRRKIQAILDKKNLNWITVEK